MVNTASIINLITADVMRMQALELVHSLHLPDYLIAAGFVRNLIWDNQFSITSPLNDIDVIYFCEKDCSRQRDNDIEQQLITLMPDLPWSVKNQARMHSNNNHRPYKNTLDAMSFWPEQQTAIGVRLNRDNALTLSHCFDVALQTNSKINHNTKCSKLVFNQRVLNKRWQKTWPLLRVED